MTWLRIRVEVSGPGAGQLPLRLEADLQRPRNGREVEHLIVETGALFDRAAGHVFGLLAGALRRGKSQI